MVGHLRLVADPDRAQADRQQQQRAGLAAPGDTRIALDGLLDPEAGQTVLAALEPWPARPTPPMLAVVASGGPMPWPGWPAGCWRAGGSPQTGGLRPPADRGRGPGQPAGPPGAVGGEVGGLGPLAPAACRRLACDGAVTRVLVCRQPNTPGQGGQGSAGPAGHHHPHGSDHPGSDPGLAGRLQAALAWLPPILGGAPSQPLDLGRTTRVVTPAQPSALAVRDGGWVFPDCQRPAGLV